MLIVACCGGLGFMAYFGNKLEKATRAEAVEADAAWEKGDKAGAVRRKGRFRGCADEQLRLRGREPVTACSEAVIGC